MYTYINKAIQACKPLYLLLDDGSEVRGIPSWGINRSWLKLSISELRATIWIPLDDIKHVTTSSPL